ncbi:MAG: mercuric transport protein MerTP [Cyclobacteriaceae bacterium]
MDNQSSSLALTSLLTAISASLCCITPVIALLAGSSSIAATFSWVEPFRPLLIGLTVGVLAFAWYQKLRSNRIKDLECACDEDKQPSLLKSRKFLGLVTIFAILMLALPYYTDAFYPETKLSTLENEDSLTTYQINIKGMTCTGCEEHVKGEIGKLAGISKLEVSYEQANAVVTFDASQTNIEQVTAAIGGTGYEIKSTTKSE